MAVSPHNTQSTRQGLTGLLARLALPLFSCVVLLLLAAGWPENAAWLGLSPAPDTIAQVARLWRVGCWLAFGFLVNRLLLLFVWQGLLAREGKAVPGMVVTLSKVVVWTLIVGLIVIEIYDTSFTAVIATSTVLIGVAGFALRGLIADFFSGILLSIERPYIMGDWLQVEPGGIDGKVIDFNWRSTRILTTENITVVVPNNHLVTYPFKNYSLPQPWFRDEIRVPLGFDVTTHQGQRILLSAVNQIDEIAGLPEKPSVTIADYDNRGVVWVLQYWVPDRSKLSSIRFKVHQNILRNLHFAGLEIPLPQEDVRLHRGKVEDVDATGRLMYLLGQSPLFRDLTSGELLQLAGAATQRISRKDEAILTQGQPGASLFILNEGLLSVWVNGNDGSVQAVGHVHPGEFFGELSLMTGAARGATVIPVTDCLVTELGKDAMQTILHTRPELAEFMSRALAQRQEANTKSLKSTGATPAAPAKETLAQQLLGQIRAFFAL